MNALAKSGDIEQLTFDQGCLGNFMLRLMGEAALIVVRSFSHAEKSGNINWLAFDRGCPDDFMLRLTGDMALIVVRSFSKSVNMCQQRIFINN